MGFERNGSGRLKIERLFMIFKAAVSISKNYCQGSFSRSAFPPERIKPILFPLNLLLFSIIVPRVIAAEGSTIIFILSQIILIAVIVEVSSTVIISLTLV